MAVDAVKAMHVDFAKKVRKTEKKANIALICMLVTLAVQITGQYLLNIEWLEMIGRATWIVAYIAWLWYLLRGMTLARKATAMQHMFIDILTEDFPEIEINVGEAPKQKENPFDKVEEVQKGEAPKVETKKEPKKRTRKVPVKSA